MDASSSLKYWELDNNIHLVDPTRDALYALNPATNAAAATTAADQPWTTNPRHFKRARISAVALIKMVMHARSGGALEVMGMMQGHVDGDTFVVTDAFRLPVEGTETRVNAQADAEEYMVVYSEMCRKQGGRGENIVGWYHSHPGYGCWLSGIDVGTQTLQQRFQDPFLAVVIDPDRTINAGKVEIGAFRTLPEIPAAAADGVAAGGGAGGQKKKKPVQAGHDHQQQLQLQHHHHPHHSAAPPELDYDVLGVPLDEEEDYGDEEDGGGSDSGSSSNGPHAQPSLPSAPARAPTLAPSAVRTRTTAVPPEKTAEFGAHASRYYALEVSHFKSTLDSLLLEKLWEKYWVQTLSQSPLFASRDFGSKRLADLAGTATGLAAEMARPQPLGPPRRKGNGGGGGGGDGNGGGGGGGGGGADVFGKRPVDVALEELAVDVQAAAMRELTGLAALETKALLFGGGGGGGGKAGDGGNGGNGESSRGGGGCGAEYRDRLGS